MLLLLLVLHRAQYISVGAGDQSPADELPFSYKNLAAQGLLVPFTDAVQNTRPGHDEQSHYVAPKGLSSVVKSLLDGVNVTYGRHVASMEQCGEGESAVWRVADTEGGTEEFDGVILTIPAPQLLQIKGTLPALLAGEAGEPLRGVRYSSRWAMGLYYPPEAWSILDDLPWAARYVKKEEDDALVFISFESRKRGAGKREEQGPGPVLMLHSSVPWGIQHMESDPREVGEALQASLAKFIPALMPAAETKVLKWRYSQVRPGSEAGQGKVAALDLSPPGKGPLLWIAGDSVSGSNFENCCRSATEAARMVEERLAGGGKSSL